MKYIVKTPKGLIAGFNNSHLCVQIAGSADWAKLFATRKAAEKFIEKYSNAGYGLNSADAEIIAL